jgi:beta-lactam-binding protein with PASTA domain
MAGSWLTGERTARASLGLVLVAGGAAVAFGTGYRASGVVMDGGGAFLQKGHRLVHANVHGRDTDAISDHDLAQRRETLLVSQDATHMVYTVNLQTGDVYRVPPDTMEPRLIGQHSEAAGHLSLASGGRHTYLLDKHSGQLSLLTPDRGQRPVPDIPRLDQLAVDDAGIAWTYSGHARKLYAIDGTQVRGSRPAAAPGEHPQLTLAGDRPVLYQPDRGQAVVYDGGGPPRTVDLGAKGGQVAAPTTGGSRLVLVTGHTMVSADLSGSSRVRRIPLTGAGTHDYRAPVVNGDRAYVPDYSTHSIIPVDLATARPQPPLTVPPGKGPGRDFQVAVQGNHVWANDPYGQHVLAVDAAGHPIDVDKGTGDGVDQQAKGGQSPAGTSPAPTGSVPVPGPTTTSPVPAPNGPSSPVPSTRKVPVPPVTGLPTKQACAQIVAARLGCTLVARPAAGGQTDTVTGTNPRERTLVDEGTQIIVYYRGPVSVPSVLGQPQDLACTAIRAANLTCRPVASGTAATAGDVGKVAGENPPADTPVRTGTTVTITYPDKVAVPPLNGLPIDDACQALVPAGFTCDKQDLGPGSPTGTVLGQNPTAGQPAAPGSKVTITYHGSPPVVSVPPLTGMSPDAACNALTTAGLRCDPRDTEQTQETNVVHGQSPPAGSPVAPGSAVTYTYQSQAPTGIQRYKAPGTPPNYLTISGPVPGGWSTQSSPGKAYTPGTPNLGLAHVYQYYCPPGAGTAGNSYYLSQNPAPPSGTCFLSAGTAFDAFPNQVTGTVPLDGLMNGQGIWVWAVPGSGEWNVFTANGFNRQFTVAYIWPP